MIGNLEHKLDEIEILFTDCLSSYQDPKRFLTYLHSLIQALRNFTSAVQANKGEIADFDTWYEEWQKRMRTDKFMSWLNSTRVGVVHKDILAADSFAKIKLMTDYSEVWHTESFGYMTSLDELTSTSSDLVKQDPSLSHTTVLIERRYLVEVDGKKYDVMGVLAHDWIMLRTLAKDLDVYMKNGNHIEGDLPPIKNPEKFQKEHHFVHFKLKDGQILRPVKERVEIDKKMRKEIKKRYEAMPKIDFDNQDSETVARSAFEAAKYMFELDGHHIQVIHQRAKGQWLPFQSVNLQDRSEKILFWHSIAEAAKKKKVDAIIFVGETWFIPDVEKGIKRIQSGKEISTLRKKGEALMVFYADKTGKTLSLISPIKRGEDKVPKLDGVIETRPALYEVGFMLPVFIAWGLIKPETIEYKE
jgi:hypothetical protein